MIEFLYAYHGAREWIMYREKRAQIVTWLMFKARR